MSFLSKKILPFILLFSLFYLFWHALFHAKKNELASTLIGENLPEFALPELNDPNRLFSAKNFPHKVSLLNVWATWCYACIIEQPMLMKIKNDYHVPIYGIDYKDQPELAKDWLAKYGNPFVMIGNDLTGSAVIDLGVYGTPETFVISPAKKIIYRHVGIIDQKTWDEVLYPLIKKYET